VSRDYIHLSEKDFSRGIDQQSPETRLKPGFCEDLLNVDLDGQAIKKRPGYQPYAGPLPLRVVRVEYVPSKNLFCLFFEEGLLFDFSASVPILVWGRLGSKALGDDFTSFEDRLIYCPSIISPRQAGVKRDSVLFLRPKTPVLYLFTNTSSVIFVWGLESVVSTRSSKKNLRKVHYLDRYQNSYGEKLLISGSSGNLYAARERTPLIAKSYGYPSFYSPFSFAPIVHNESPLIPSSFLAPTATNILYGSSGVGFFSPLPLLAGDMIVLHDLPQEKPLFVKSSWVLRPGWIRVQLSDIPHLVTLTKNTAFSIRRSSEVFLLSTSPNARTLHNLVLRDSLYDGNGKSFEVQDLYSSSDIPISLSGNGQITTVKTKEKNDQFFGLYVGKKILILSEPYTESFYKVEQILSETSFKMKSSVKYRHQGVLLGNTVSFTEKVTLDLLTDKTPLFHVTKRWLPIVAPRKGFTRTTYASYLSPTSSLRSTVVSDNLYLTNREDAVLKFDGVSIYRAGLPRWHPGFLVAKDSQALAKIPVKGKTVYRYYFKIVSIDRNHNRIESAATDSEEFNLTLKESAAVQFRLLNMPASLHYDYERMSLEIYRTKANGRVFYKIHTRRLTFNLHYGEILFTDSVADDTLTEGGLDLISSTLIKGDIPSTHMSPILAKHVTSADNRLLLANLKDYPQLDLQFESQPSIEGFTGQVFTLTKPSSDSSQEFTETYELLGEKNVRDLASIKLNPKRSGHLYFELAEIELPPGTWVYIFQEEGASPSNLLPCGLWQTYKEPRINPLLIRGAFSKDAYNAYLTAQHLDNPPKYKLIFASNLRHIPVYCGPDGSRLNQKHPASPRMIVARRLADMINASMVMRDEERDFIPWMIAYAGSDFRAGQVLIRQPAPSGSAVTLRLAGDPSTKMFVNNIERSSRDLISATSKLFPSRLIVSYRNFPEIFDTLNTPQEGGSHSIIDIHSADGDEITGILPFFGEAVVGNSQRSSVLIVFKKRSIYLVDILRHKVESLETYGIGCTVSASLCVTEEGLMFASEFGVYRLDRQLSLTLISEKLGRLWDEKVHKPSLSLACAHHDPIKRQYQLSVPVKGEEFNSEVYVYHYGQKSEKFKGAWTRYDNHHVTGWASLEGRTYFSSTDGYVYSVGQTEKFSYRDHGVPIHSVLITRMMDMDAPGIRKIISWILSYFRGASLKGRADLSVSLDREAGFTPLPPVLIGDSSEKKVFSLKTSLPRRRIYSLQLKYENNRLDQGFGFAGFDMRVAALPTKLKV